MNTLNDRPAESGFYFIFYINNAAHTGGKPLSFSKAAGQQGRLTVGMAPWQRIIPRVISSVY